MSERQFDDEHGQRPAESQTFASAVKWSFVMDAGRQFLTTAITFVLARQLGPEVYGIAGLALVFVFFVQLIQSQGIVAAIVQRDDLRSSHLDSAFWGLLGVSAILVTGALLGSGLYARMNSTPDLQIVVVAMTPMIPLQGLTLVQEAVVRRRMEFRVLAIRTNLSVIIAGIVAIVLALLGAGVWSIVVQQVLGAAIGLVVLWGLSDWRPSLRFSWPALRQLLRFSVPSFGAGLAAFVVNQADSIIIGVFFGPLAVGLYRFAVRVVNTIATLAARAFQNASLPELARYQNDRAQVSERVQSIIRVSTLASFPLLAILAASSDDIIALAGNDDWGPAASVLRIISVAAMVRAMVLVSGPMMQALDHPRLLAAVSWATAGVTVAAQLATGLLLRDNDEESQVVGMAFTKSAVAVLFTMTAIGLVTRHLLGLGVSHWVRAIGPAALGAVTAFVIGIGVAYVMPLDPGFIRLMVIGTTSAVAAGLVLWSTSNEVQLVADKALSKVGRRVL